MTGEYSQSLYKELVKSHTKETPYYVERFCTRRDACSPQHR
jgi:hypothetical protein